MFEYFARKAREKRELQLAQVSTYFLDIAYEAVRVDLQSDIPMWDLDNKKLQTCLGYIAGVVDAAHQALNAQNHRKYDEPMVDKISIVATSRYLRWIPGADEVISLGLGYHSEIGTGSALVAGLQTSPRFVVAMQRGGQDFSQSLSGQISSSGLTELLDAKQR